jgi:hypothetical protein
MWLGRGERLGAGEARQAACHPFDLSVAPSVWWRMRVVADDVAAEGHCPL